MPGRVRTRRQFAQFANPTGRGASGPLRISFVATEPPDHSVRVAYAISTAVGSAVTRNRIRRRLRAQLDGLTPPPRPGFYLIKCGIQTGSLNYDELLSHLRSALERAGSR